MTEDDLAARQSGYAVHPRAGYSQHVPSCQDCAKKVGAPWVPALFEGECAGCECVLSGLPIAGVR